MITPLEVVDTALKIGLGALISGAGAYWVATINHYRQVQKERTSHRRELLENVADSVQKYYHAAAKQRSFVEYVVKMADAGVSPSDEHYSELRRNEAELLDKLGDLTSAEAKLLLLNERETYTLLRQLHESVVIYSTDYLKRLCAVGPITGEIWSRDFLKNYQTTLRDRRDTFFTSLSSSYDRAISQTDRR